MLPPEADPAAVPPEADFGARAAAALRFLAEVHEDSTRLLELDEATRRQLLELAGRVARPEPWQKRAFVRAAR